jgi:hypothetical protein
MPVFVGSFRISGAWTIWENFRGTWDFDTDRSSDQPGSPVTDVPRQHATWEVAAANVRCHNVITHDLGGGWSAFSQSPAAQLHECVAYNNGWNAPDRGHGHGFYMQSAANPNIPADRKLIRGFVSFGNFGSNGKLGGSDATSNLIGFRYDGCTFFDPGIPVLSSHPPEPNFVCDGASSRKGHIDLWRSSLWMRDSGTYNYSATDAPLSLWLGDVNEGATPVTLNNVRIQGRTRLGNWASLTGSGVTMGMGNDTLPWTLGRALLMLQPTPSPFTKYSWNNNRYAHVGDERIMLAESTMQNLAGWRVATGYDTNSTHTVGQFTTAEVEVVASEVDPNRSTITVWNYSGAGTAQVNVSSVLNVGDGYTLYHIYDWVGGGTTTLTGTYNGAPLTVPMGAKTPPTPQGWSSLPQLPNTFGVFVLLRTAASPAPITSMIASTRIGAAQIAASAGTAQPPPTTPQSGERFTFALVTLAPLTRQDAPGAPVALTNERVYTIPFLRLLNGDDVEGSGPGDFRGFTVVLPVVTRLDL